jgi:hypothetical protein
MYSSVIENMKIITKQNSGKGPLLSKRLDNNKTVLQKVNCDVYPEIFFRIQHLYFNQTNVKWALNGGYEAQLKQRILNPILLKKYFINYQNAVGKFQQNINDTIKDESQVLNSQYFSDPYGLTVVWLSFIKSTIERLEKSIHIVNQYLAKKVDETKYKKNIKKDEDHLSVNYTNYCKSIVSSLGSGVYVPEEFFVSINALYKFYYYSQFVSSELYSNELQDIYKLEISNKNNNKQNINLEVIAGITPTANDDCGVKHENIARAAYEYIQENIKMSYAFQFEILKLAHRFQHGNAIAKDDRVNNVDIYKLQYFQSKLMFQERLPYVLKEEQTSGLQLTRHVFRLACGATLLSMCISEVATASGGLQRQNSNLIV